MKKIFGITLPLALFFCSSTPSSSPFSVSPTSDSLIIEHKLDGNPDEWPSASLQTDQETQIEYAVDNDANNLYALISIKDRGEQMKLIRMGMRFFIDLKAKKKENMGVEFPVKRAPGSGYTARPEQGAEGDNRRPDPREMRDKMTALYMYSLKLFGFEGMDEPKETGLTMFNTVNLAYAWNDQDVLTIEYQVPLNMIDASSSLKDKEVSIGWKIFGFEVPGGSGAGAPGGFTGGRGGGGRPPSGRPAGGGGGNSGGSADRQPSAGTDLRKEQQIWSHYTIRIAESMKGF